MWAKRGSSGCRSKPTPSRPRAPCEACGRTSSSLSGGRPWRARCRLSAWPRSGAVSTRLPSRSNRTARMFSSFTVSIPPSRRHQVVDVGIGFQLVDLGQRVVGQADELLGVESGFARHAGELGGLDELGVVVGSARQELEDVFGADDGEQVALGVAVERREEHPAARLDQPGAGGNDGGGIGYVLEHFHAGDDVELAGVLRGIVFGGDMLVVDALARLVEMQYGDLERLFRQVDAADSGAGTGHRLG